MKKIKKDKIMRNKFRMMLLSMATLGLFSCYYDKLVDEVSTQPSQQEEADGYVAFKISTIGSDSRTTRADDDTEISGTEFSTGEGQEFAISSERGSSAVFFFKKEGNDYEYHSKADLQLNTGNGTPDHGNEYGESAEEKVYKAHISTDLVEEDHEAYCVVILNADPSTFRTLHSSLAGKTLTEFMQSETALALTSSGRYDNYFTMTNTIYIGSEDKIQGPTQVAAKNIKETIEEAEKEPINVHVERLVAKYELELTQLSEATNNVIVQDKTQRLMETDGITDVKWAVKILGWDVSGLEKTTYWFKNLYDGSNFTASFSYPEATMSEKAFGKWAFDAGVKGGWNDVSRVRSYWAVDPHYNSSSDFYPTQYRYDGMESSVLKKDEGENTSALEYKSYEDLASYTGSETGLAKYRYSLENTFGNYKEILGDPEIDGDYAYTGEGYKQVDTHILIKAQLLLGTTAEATPSEQTDIYYYDNCYWTDESKLLDKMIEELIYTYASTGLYYGTGHTQLTTENAKTEDLFEIVSAKGVEHADGRVMLQLKNEKLYTKEAESEYTEITNATLISDNDRNLVTAKHYKNGYMYYAIPIRHLARTTTTDDGTFKYNIGSFGAVRNHWYKATVKGITNPGTSVDDPKQPIIPDNDPDENGYASFEIQIIPWRVVDWEVDL